MSGTHVTNRSTVLGFSNFSPAGKPALQSSVKNADGVSLSEAKCERIVEPLAVVGGCRAIFSHLKNSQKREARLLAL